MLCNQCQELISDYIDGALEFGEQLQVERHLADCEACRAVRDDLLQIVHFSRQLPLQTPSGAVWARIKSEVAQEQSVSSWSRIGRWLATIKTSRFDLSLPQLAASAAMLVLVASVTVVLLKRQGLPSDKSAVVGPSSYTARDKNALAHRDIQQIEGRINELNETIEQHKSLWDDGLRATFQRNMANVEQSLAECHHELADNPEDDISQELMLSAYREKMRLLEGFAKF